jgi:hypothetical protein
MKAKIHESDELRLGNTVQVHVFENAPGFAITFAKIEKETEKSFFFVNVDSLSSNKGKSVWVPKSAIKPVSIGSYKGIEAVYYTVKLWFRKKLESEHKLYLLNAFEG